MRNTTVESSRQASRGRGERISTDDCGSALNTVQRQFRRIKLGIDVHAKQYVVVRQIDDAAPQPAQKFTPEQFESFVRRQLALAEEVHSCYEAGPFGYVLHRKLVAMGVKNVVVCPQDWDERNKKVKTDRTDGLALCQRLDRYVAGNHKALAVVKVPTLEQETSRSRSRERETFKRELVRWGARGRSLMLNYGVSYGGRWWEPGHFAKAVKRLHEELPDDQAAGIALILEDYRQMIVPLETKLAELTAELEQARDQRRHNGAARAGGEGEEDLLQGEQVQGEQGVSSSAASLPRGFGALTTEKLNREVGDWGRFANRRQVASYTGLCPGVHASGTRCREGSITKHGNPRVRADLIELAWRMTWYQPDYPPVVRWRAVLDNRRAPRSARKRAIVAIARRLAVDHWRLATGRATAAGLKLACNGS